MSNVRHRQFHIHSDEHSWFGIFVAVMEMPQECHIYTVMTRSSLIICKMCIMHLAFWWLYKYLASLLLLNLLSFINRVVKDKIMTFWLSWLFKIIPKTVCCGKQSLVIASSTYRLQNHIYHQFHKPINNPVSLISILVVSFFVLEPCLRLGLVMYEFMSCRRDRRRKWREWRRRRSGQRRVG